MYKRMVCTCPSRQGARRRACSVVPDGRVRPAPGRAKAGRAARTAPMLEVDVEVPLGGFNLAARFASGAAVTALFGRSGSGKTTLVDCIAGLRRPARGRIAVGGTVLFDG